MVVIFGRFPSILYYLCITFAIFESFILAQRTNERTYPRPKSKNCHRTPKLEKRNTLRSEKKWFQSVFGAKEKFINLFSKELRPRKTRKVMEIVINSRTNNSKSIFEENPPRSYRKFVKEKSKSNRKDVFSMMEEACSDPLNEIFSSFSSCASSSSFSSCASSSCASSSSSSSTSSSSSSCASSSSSYSNCDSSATDDNFAFCGCKFEFECKVSICGGGRKGRSSTNQPDLFSKSNDVLSFSSRIFTFRPSETDLESEYEDGMEELIDQKVSEGSLSSSCSSNDETKIDLRNNFFQVPTTLIASTTTSTHEKKNIDDESDHYEISIEEGSTTDYYSDDDESDISSSSNSNNNSNYEDEDEKDDAFIYISVANADSNHQKRKQENSLFISSKSILKSSPNSRKFSGKRVSFNKLIYEGETYSNRDYDRYLGREFYAMVKANSDILEALRLAANTEE